MNYETASLFISEEKVYNGCKMIKTGTAKMVFGIAEMISGNPFDLFRHHENGFRYSGNRKETNGLSTSIDKYPQTKRNS